MTRSGGQVGDRLSRARRRSIVFPGDKNAFGNDAFRLVRIFGHDGDMDFKAQLYARAGVREYWVENLVDDEIEVFREPHADGYGSQRTYRRGESIALVSFPDVELAVDELLP